MKAALRIVWHVLAVGAGFWLMPRPSTQVEKTTSPLTKKTQPLLANFTQATAATLPEIEKRFAELTPENWANELNTIATLPIDDLPLTLRGLLRSRFPQVRRRLIRAVFERWAELDRHAALTALASLSSPQMKGTALAAILGVWVKTDPDAAWQWVAGLEHDSVLQEAGVMELISLTATNDLDHYRTWALQIDDPLLRNKLLAHLASQWAEKDPVVALDAAFLEDDSILRSALFHAAFGRSRRGENMNKQEVLDRLLQLPDQSERIKRISEDWLPEFISDSPEAASAWVAAHSQRPELQRSAAMIGSSLGGKVETISSLLHYGSQLKLGPLRDAFFASAAAGWASAKKPSEGTQQLLDQCGPCLEREEALTFIQQLTNPR